MKARSIHKVLIHSACSDFFPHMSSVRRHFSYLTKAIQFSLKIDSTTGGTVDMAERIIDETCLVVSKILKLNMSHIHFKICHESVLTNAFKLSMWEFFPHKHKT